MVDQPVNPAPAADGRWMPTGSMTTARASFTLTLLQNGQALAAGGFGSTGRYGVHASAELYDPATGSWALTGSMHAERIEHTAVLLPTGQVLVAGGSVGEHGAYASAELYDPTTGVWAAAEKMNYAHANHTATLLPAGTVLVAGEARSGVSTSAATAELYDPVASSWSVTGRMLTWRSSHTATLLPNGQVLVAGGLVPIHIRSARLKVI